MNQKFKKNIIRWKDNKWKLDLNLDTKLKLLKLKLK